MLSLKRYDKTLDLFAACKYNETEEEFNFAVNVVQFLETETQINLQWSINYADTVAWVSKSLTVQS